MRLFLAGLALLLLPQQAAAVSGEDVHTFTLENGLEAVVIVDRRAPVVTNMVWYRVGSADEPAGRSGVAHFLEHLMFEGTDDIPKGAFSRIVADNGGVDNAFTSYDYTGYFQRVARDRLELMMKMEADRMRDLVISDEVVEPELQVVIEERNLRVENNPGAIFGEHRSAAQYLNHAYGRPIIGWRHEMTALTKADALDFYGTYYAPNNAILIVAGDVDPAEVEALAQQYFGPLEPSDTLPPRVRPQEPPQLAARRVEYIDARAGSPYVIRSYLAPSRQSGDQAQAAALVILADLLGDGVTAHLTQSLQFEEEVAVSSSAFYNATMLDDTTFGLFVVPKPGIGLREAETKLDAAMAAFMEEGPNPEHLARVKKQIAAAQIYALDDQEGRARNYGISLTAGLTVEDVENWPAALAAVTAEDVMAAAREVFDPRRSVTGYLMSSEADREGTTE
ncbi:M16 family metallopeptidase [Algicella marina]|uniref:Insulinase family protein n=1 Tax=Algicella marina TaxID=2683284 RepID=A0A6P1T5W6_9RHOB|nr:pitrilysin family protein [Algicella marina]QHQ35952.1 insulinase family protein [Algicella marina]